MTYTLIISIAAALGFAGAALALALRNGGLKEDLTDREAKLKIATADIATLTDGLHKLRGEVQGAILARDREVARLKRRLAGMRAQIAKLPDSPVNREHVLRELDRVLLEAKADSGHPNG